MKATRPHPHPTRPELSVADEPATVEETAARSTARRLHPSRRTTGPLDTAILADIAAGLAATVDTTATLEPWVLEREQLLATEAYDAWVMRFGPAAVVETHDHDGSIGVLHVVDGQILEATGSFGSPVPTPIARFLAGDVTDFGVTDLHVLYNPTARTTTTVNVYSPPLGPCGSPKADPSSSGPRPNDVPRP